MHAIPKKFKKLILVCTNVRDDGRACCGGPLTGSGTPGSKPLQEALKAACKERKLPVRVSKTGCLGNCETGPTVVIMPDDLWFGGVTESDIPAILDLAAVS